jgi:ABC-type sugar transport system ATPase subunit
VLDVSLDAVSFRYDQFALSEVTLTFARSTHTAIVGPPGCGASTLLRVLAGEIRPRSGNVRIGTRVVNDIGTARRPLLYATSDIGVSGRWSVHHALVNAVRSRTLDRQDRFHELSMAASKWQLEPLLDRKISTLGGTERVRVLVARIELLNPAILVADRLLANASASAQLELADDFYRALRVMGTTMICAPASTAELGLSDSVVVLDRGRVVQRGNAAEIFGSPADDAAALATGQVNSVPVRIRGNVVESVIGEWTVAVPPFEGSGIALIRPDDFAVAGPGEDSDLIFGIEEAAFQNGRWIARGLLTGGNAIRVALPRDFAIRKGRLIALRYDPAAFTLLPREAAEEPPDSVPPMKETR